MSFSLTIIFSKVLIKRLGSGSSILTWPMFSFLTESISDHYFRLYENVTGSRNTTNDVLAVAHTKHLLAQYKTRHKKIGLEPFRLCLKSQSVLSKKNFGLKFAV